MDNKRNKLDILFKNACKYCLDNKYNQNEKNTIQTKTKLYKYYKQATCGDVTDNIKCPSIFNVKDKVKWEAWNSLKGMSKDKSKLLYIDLLNQLNPEWNN